MDGSIDSDGDDDDEDEDDEEEDWMDCFGCCEIRTPIRSAWTSSVAMAPPVDRLQSKAFATLEGATSILMSCLELFAVLTAAISDN